MTGSLKRALCELSPGDTVVLLAEPKVARSGEKKLTVKRLNRVSLTTSDGRRWNARTCTAANH